MFTENELTKKFPTVVAIIDEKNFPWVVVCTETWQPSYVLRRGEQQTVVNTSFDKAKDQCWREYCCLNRFCPYNKTDKDYAEARLSKPEQEFLEKYRLDIVDQCREAFEKSPKNFQIVYVELKEKPPGA